jgi:hypothetical protein
MQSCKKIGGAVEECIDVVRGDYSAVKIPENATIYCDIPYSNTNCGQYQGFNHERFYDWVRTRTFPVYISEYTMPDDFTPIAAIQKQVLSAANKPTKAIEKIFVHNKWADAHRVTTLFAE